jgi:16S rRNA (guanine527-N7)-methyltransferase
VFQYNVRSMHAARIAELLRPFLAARTGACSQSRPAPAPGTADAGQAATLSTSQLESISIYVDILLRWNARVNLTAVRQPEEIVTRHFGESLFAARHLFPAPGGYSPSAKPAGADAAVGRFEPSAATTNNRVIDVGSGAGFPGLPIKIWAPQVHLTLIESNHKKATFLREVARALRLTNIDVVTARAESFSGQGEVVVLRAVERFGSVLPVAIRLVVSGGRLALLVGDRQLQTARQLAAAFRWSEPMRIPLSTSRVLIIGSKEPF